MDEQLPWFRSLPADQRSWVTLVAQAGLQSYVEWLRQPDDVLRLTGEVFAAAPRTMARSVTLQQTVELVRQTIAVAEENLPLLAGADDRDVVSEELLRFSREIAFAAARVYAIAAERRGSWDARLEALVIERLISGIDVGDDRCPASSPRSAGTRRADLGVIAGAAPADPKQDVRTEIHALTRRLRRRRDGRRARRPAGRRLRRRRPTRPWSRPTLLPVFGDGPVVVGPTGAATRPRRSRSPRRRCPACARHRPGPARRARCGRRPAARAGAARRRRGARATGRDRLPPAARRRRRPRRHAVGVPRVRRGARGDRTRAVRPRQHGALPAAAGRRGLRRGADRRRAAPSSLRSRPRPGSTRHAIEADPTMLYAACTR